MAADYSQLDVNHWIYRFLALIIDSIIIAIPAAIIYYIVLIPLLWTSVVIGFAYVAVPWWGGFLLLPFILGIIEVLYFAVLDSAWGATIGKRIMGLQVQTTNGGRVTFGKAFIRNISKIYALFLLLDWIIGMVTISSDRRQKYTDRIAGTTVVALRQPFTSVPPPPPPPPPPS